MEENEKIKEQIESKKEYQKILSKRNKNKLIVPIVVTGISAFLAILGTSMFGVNLKVGMILFVLGISISLVGIITIGIMYIVFKNKELEVEMEIKELKSKLIPVASDGDAIQNSTIKKRGHKGLLITLVCIVLILAIVIPIVCVNFSKEKQFISLQYKTISTTSQVTEIKVQINNNTSKEINLNTSDFTVKINGLPVGADYLLQGYVGGIRMLGSEITVEMGEEAVITIYFEKDYNTFDKPLKLYYRAREVYFEKATTIDVK